MLAKIPLIALRIYCDLSETVYSSRGTPQQTKTLLYRSVLRIKKGHLITEQTKWVKSIYYLLTVSCALRDSKLLYF